MQHVYICTLRLYLLIHSRGYPLSPLFQISWNWAPYFHSEDGRSGMCECRRPFGDTVGAQSYHLHHNQCHCFPFAWQQCKDLHTFNIILYICPFGFTLNSCTIRIATSCTHSCQQLGYRTWACYTCNWDTCAFTWATVAIRAIRFNLSSTLKWEGTQPVSSSINASKEVTVILIQLFCEFIIIIIFISIIQISWILTITVLSIVRPFFGEEVMNLLSLLVQSFETYSLHIGSQCLPGDKYYHHYILSPCQYLCLGHHIHHGLQEWLLNTSAYIVLSTKILSCQQPQHMQTACIIYM